jgi:endonuclease III
MPQLSWLIDALESEFSSHPEPYISQVRRENFPYKVLIGTLISLRTKDRVTEAATSRLFELAKSPEAMLLLSEDEIQKAIYPAGFYRTKARTIREVSKKLIDLHNGKVPDTLEALIALKGVGRKTANLVLTEGFGKLGLCVDTHVHRISNRLGLVSTKDVHKTEFALRKLLPSKYWRLYTLYLVAHGQNICTPISPKCSICPLSSHCRRIGVKKHR